MYSLEQPVQKRLKFWIKSEFHPPKQNSVKLNFEFMTIVFFFEKIFDFITVLFFSNNTVIMVKLEVLSKFKKSILSFYLILYNFIQF
jgi:hypothetical protein